MSKRTSYIVVVAAAGLAAMILAAPAQANPVRFDNPAHDQPGHYHWAEVAPVTGFLKVTLPYDQQPVPSPGGIGAFCQSMNVTVPRVNMSSGAAGTNLQKGGYNGAFVLSIDYGDPIPGDGSGYTWAESGYTYHAAHPQGSEIPAGIEQYLGVRFDPGDGLGYHYGWIGVVRTGYQLETFAWGYETLANTPIPAGAPEPASLMLLALGAVAAMRRKA
jgi:hypothetical protein